MRGIYLAAHKAYHPGYDLDYNDYLKTSEHINILGDMLQVDLKDYDYIIATPPCNYYSKARGNRTPSQYALDTKHLLPEILKKLSKQDKPFIVENVRAFDKFKNLGLFDLDLFVYFVGRHTYWTNVMFNPEHIPQAFDFSYNGKRLVENSQGGVNVHKVIQYWLEVIHSK